MTSESRTHRAKKKKRKWSMAICPRCWAEPNPEVDPLFEGDLRWIPKYLREPDQPAYTHECRICGLQVRLHKAGPKRTVASEAELFAALDLIEPLDFEQVVTDETVGHVRCEWIDYGFTLIGGRNGIDLEYPIDLREFWGLCTILSYVDQAAWRSEFYTPSKRELHLTIRRLTEEIAELKEENDYLREDLDRRPPAPPSTAPRAPIVGPRPKPVRFARKRGTAGVTPTLEPKPAGEEQEPSV